MEEEMILYLLKVTLCSMLLLGVYSLLLEKERMHRFNRFYLLFSVVFSFIVPLISITTASLPPSVPSNIPVLNEGIVSTTLVEKYSSVKQTSLLPNGLVMLYVVVSVCLLYRFIKNIAAVFATIRHNKKVPFLNAQLVLIPALQVSHSFFNYVFLNKEAYERGTTEDEILSHEMAHVRQKHSIDILLIEALLIFAWVNPFLYLYRRAIKLNHEFLADESVLKTFVNVQSYQTLLLNKGGQRGHLSLSSRFNYLTTKKRLIMMTQTTSNTVAAIKKIAMLPVFAVSVFVFATKVVAQEATKSKPPRGVTAQEATKSKPQGFSYLIFGDNPRVESTVAGVSQEVLNEYQSIVDKYTTTNSKGSRHSLPVAIKVKEISEEDRARLETIFKQMSREQQKKQTLAFWPAMPPSPRNIPTKAQLDAWKNASTYGLWIDGKRVKNSELNQYSNTDFANASVSRLAKNALNYGKYYYQVNLMTEEAYQKYKRERENDVANKKTYIGVWLQRNVAVLK